MRSSTQPGLKNPVGLNASGNPRQPDDKVQTDMLNSRANSVGGEAGCPSFYPALRNDAGRPVDGATTGPRSTPSYGYDGESRRVKRTSFGTTTFYVYDATGELAAEHGAVSTTSGRQYLKVDPLASTRVVVDANQAVLAGQKQDHMRFGGSLLASQNG